jgi:hypothetical protein
MTSPLESSPDVPSQVIISRVRSHSHPPTGQSVDRVVAAVLHVIQPDYLAQGVQCRVRPGRGGVKIQAPERVRGGAAGSVLVGHDAHFVDNGEPFGQEGYRAPACDSTYLTSGVRANVPL